MSPTRTETAPTIDVVGVGHAIVDVLAHTDDGFLTERGLAKGAMTLVDIEAAEALYAAMGPGVEVSGGSTANSLAGLASLGGRHAFVGRVRDDQLGSVFGHDLRAAGVGYDVAPATDGPPTARCLILVTPDAERTMHTYLGASGALAPGDIDTELVASAAITYCEGYLWDTPDAKAAITTAMDAAAAAGRLVAFNLSDGFCVERHRAEFLELIEGRVDVLFANEDEIRALYEVDDLDLALAEVRPCCRIAVVTRSEEGSVVVSGEETHQVSARPVTEVVDTTGAGDLYAAGFLFGLTAGEGLPICGALGSLTPAECISHLGARPQVDLGDLVAQLLPEP